MDTSHRIKTGSAPSSKSLHPRNVHNQSYDFPALVKSYPPLAPYVKPNTHGNLSIEFANPVAVRFLNAALLKHHYGIAGWDIPEGALCPPIPGRADYIHYVAELPGLREPASSVRLLDIGTGANGIYPLLACKIYGWQCVGSDISDRSLESVAAIIANNPDLQDSFTLRKQTDKNHIFKGIIQPGEFFDISVCNPPFHASLEEALKGSQRKLDNLARNRGEEVAARTNKNSAAKSSTANSPTLNFGGMEAELWCNGGEQLFLKKMIQESKLFANQCRWFTSLVSKAENVKPAKKLIQKAGALDVREIEMVQGNKITRILAWTFL